MNKKTVLTMAGLLIIPLIATASTEGEIKAFMSDMNVQLAAMDESVRINSVEYYTAAHEAGQIIYFDDRIRVTGERFVPSDPRRFGVNEIYWLSDSMDGVATDLSFADTQAALDRAMNTWSNMKCSKLHLVKLPDYGLDWGYVQYLIGFGGVPGWYADITHAGWMPGSFFEIIFGSLIGQETLGVTFTFVWVDPDTGEPSDIDHDRKDDVAFQESYYNNFYPWGINTPWPIDVETVVLHETGHALGLDHFGKLFETDANGFFHFAPRTIMNAGYTGMQQIPVKTDVASFCNVWASWPKK